jgi:hypothetical protein
MYFIFIFGILFQIKYYLIYIYLTAQILNILFLKNIYCIHYYFFISLYNYLLFCLYFLYFIMSYYRLLYILINYIHLINIFNFGFIYILYFHLPIILLYRFLPNNPNTIYLIFHIIYFCYVIHFIYIFQKIYMVYLIIFHLLNYQ